MRIFLGLLTISILLLSGCHDENEWTSAPLRKPTDEPVETDTTSNQNSPDEPFDWCLQNDCWDEKIFTCRDSTMIANFTRNESDGWTGGDATYSIALPGDRTLWLFGDTFIGQVKADRSRSSLSLINNSLVVQDGAEFTTFYGGTAASPEAFAKPEDPSTWYWPGSGLADEDTLYLFMHAFGTTGGMWGFFRSGVDLYRLDPNTLEVFDRTRVLDGGGISWGADVMKDGEYAYIYGVLSNETGKTLFVARTDLGFSDPWQYYNEGEWTLDAGLASSIFAGVSEQFSVFKHLGKYYLVTQHNAFGRQIYLFSSESPSGPFGNGKTVYCTPETGGNIFTYNAYAHPHLLNNGELLISYNINSFEFSDLRTSADNYRPYFIRISGWEDE